MSGAATRLLRSDLRRLSRQHEVKEEELADVQVNQPGTRRASTWGGNRNPEPVKEEPQPIQLTQHAVDTRLEQCQAKQLDLSAVTLSPHPTVSRHFLKATYGGSHCAALCRISDKSREKHQHDHQWFFAPSPQYDPYAPAHIGESGLMFHVLGMEWAESSHPLFICRKPSAWQYAGHYLVIPAESLTKAEWAAQDLKFREHWLRSLFKFKYGKIVRARVLLRMELCRAPTKLELEEAMRSRKCHESEVNLQDLMFAFDEGHERVGILCLKARHYDQGFQIELERKFRALKRRQSHTSLKKGRSK